MIKVKSLTVKNQEFHMLACYCKILVPKGTFKHEISYYKPSKGNKWLPMKLIPTSEPLNEAAILDTWNCSVIY